MASIKQFFTAPTFADESLSRRASLLSFMVNLHLVIALGVAVLFWALSREYLIYSLAALVSCLPALGVRVLIRQGRVTLAALLFIGFIAVIMPVVAFISKTSVGSVAVTAFQFVTIVMAGLLLGGRGILGFLVFTCLIDGVMLYAEADGSYHAIITRDYIQIWITQILTYSAVAALLWIANRLIRESFSRARDNEQAQMAANHQLREVQVELEARMAELKQAESALRASEQKYRRFVEESLEGFALTDEQGFIVEWNRAQEEITGMHREEVMGEPIWNVQTRMLAPERQSAGRAEALRAMVQQALQTGQAPFFGQIAAAEICQPGGQRVVVEQSTFPIKMDQGYRLGSTVRDITARKRGEEALRNSEALYQSLVEILPMSMCRKDLDGRFTFVNQRYCDEFKLPASDILGKTDVDLHPADLAEKYQEDDRVVMAAGRSIEMVEEHEPIGGERTYVQVFKSPIRDMHGQTTGTQIVFWDITERRNAEVALKERTEQLDRLNTITRSISTLQSLEAVYESIYEQLRATLPVDAFMLCLYDPERNELSYPFVMDDGRRIFEPTTTKRPGTLFDRVITTGEPVLVNRAAEHVQNTNASTAAGEADYFGTRRASASYMHVPMIAQARVIGLMSVHSYTLTAFDENTLAFFGGVALQSAIAIENARLYSAVQQELMERQRIEVQLRDSEERYRLISEVSSDYTFSTALGTQGEMRLVWVAGAFEKITGYSYEEYVARGGWRAALYPADAEQDARDMDTLRTNRPLITEVRTIVKGDEVRWVRVYAHPVWSESQNQLVGIYGAVQDITERKQIEAEREALIAELASRNAELERFTYTVSHDLKSPLVTITGFLGYLEKHALSGNTDQLKADIKRISTAAGKMQYLLNDLLELSRIGRMMNPPDAVPLVGIVQEAVELVQGHLEARGVQIDIQPDLPVVQGDRARLVEVVQNLIDNACKFMGGQSEPRITIGYRGTDEDGKPIVFVRDNGIGIDPQYHTKVFGLFDKLDPQSEGTGIGLALVKRIVEVHGGHIWVESAGLQRGSTFYFSLPAAVNEDKQG